MAIGQKQQRVSELYFYLYNRSLHPELFDIYQEQRVERGAYEAQIWVTGISHLVGFFRGDASVTELLAEDDSILPRRGRLVAAPIRGEKDHQATHVQGIRYMSSFQVERMSARVFSKMQEEELSQGPRRGLFVPFPEWGVGSLMPFTHIDYEAKVDMLHIFAYHAFPEELTVVKTQSIFELV